MRPVVCRIKAKMILAVSLLFCIGVALVFVRLRFHFLPHFFRTTLPHITGWTMIVISVLCVFVLKSIRVDQRGIHAIYIFGITRSFGFHEIAHLTAKMNLAQISMASRMSGEQRHTIQLVPTQGRMRMTISSSQVTNFMELYNVLLHTFQARMEVVDKRGAGF